MLVYIQAVSSIPGLAEVTDHLTSLVLQPLDSPARQHVCQCLAAILNKQPDGEDPVEDRIY